MGYYKNIHRSICITLIQIIENRIALIKYIYTQTSNKKQETIGLDRNGNGTESLHTYFFTPEIIIIK